VLETVFVFLPYLTSAYRKKAGMVNCHRARLPNVVLDRRLLHEERRIGSGDDHENNHCAQCHENNHCAQCLDYAA